MSDDSLATCVGRVEELEIRLVFQEDMLSELNKVLARQDAELIKLREQVKSLSEKHLDLQYRVDQRGEISDERPPHY
ncbi:SlyX family protein [Simiduia sp. 21SJ11W-1]|uniref:SlyX family protein n=1 Tax=Simiduia sp. 21SJ11W-1 TaxID=2909669 RepID=UPI00209C923D|nr:SlyX family protein [Simiduia sp. 21SJ11W-1]UTA49080.1 SlyX family protein [Simiduia sp. 21SJ11W-1]